ncbi:MAG: DUF1707 domain-containing protein [Jatrophihabitantaceae bacterium]
MAGWQFGSYLQGPGRDIRIGTAEREQAVQLLSEHLSAGRLELTEFEERVTAAYAARTESQLAALFRDLPGPLPPTAGYPAVSRWPVPRRVVLLAVVVLIVAFLVADIAFPPFLLIPICWLVIRRRRRYALAGYHHRRRC